LKIAVDVDGVLADVIVTWLDIYNAEHHNSVTKDEVNHWDFFGRLNIDRVEFDRIFELAWKNWRAIPPCETMLSQKVRDLSNLGKVSIVTARSTSSIPSVKAWLSDKMISYDDMIVVDYGPLKSELEFDVFIDDSPLNAKNIAATGKLVLLFDQPWNRDVSGEGIVRISGFPEAIATITHLGQKKVKEDGN